MPKEYIQHGLAGTRVITIIKKGGSSA